MDTLRQGERKREYESLGQGSWMCIKILLFDERPPFASNPSSLRIPANDHHDRGEAENFG